MWALRKLWAGSSYAWLLLLLCFVAGITWGQESPETSGPNVLPLQSGSLKTQSPELTPLPPELTQRWNEYSEQFGAFTMTLEQFLDQVETFGVSFEELPSFIDLLISSYRDSEDLRMNERGQSDRTLTLAIDKGVRAEQSRDRWRTTGIVWIALAIVEAVTIGLIVALK